MKTDRRTKYTKMVISEAFMQLIKNKPIQKITVADICALADISRPTFYLHYSDIYALIDEIGENMIVSANLGEMAALTLDKPNKIHDIIVNLIRVVESNADIYRICVLERGTPTVLPARIKEELKNTIMKKFEDDNIFDERADKKYILEFIQSAFNSIIYCWLNKQEGRESADELANTIETFLVYGLKGFVA